MSRQWMQVTTAAALTVAALSAGPVATTAAAQDSGEGMLVAVMVKSFGRMDLDDVFSAKVAKALVKAGYRPFLTDSLPVKATWMPPPQDLDPEDRVARQAAAFLSPGGMILLDAATEIPGQIELEDVRAWPWVVDRSRLRQLAERRGIDYVVTGTLEVSDVQLAQAASSSGRRSSVMVAVDLLVLEARDGAFVNSYGTECMASDAARELSVREALSCIENKLADLMTPE